MVDRRVRDLGEFGLIARLAARLAAPARAPAVDEAIGDDAAVWRPTPGWASVQTTDTMIAGVHFTPATTPWRDLGWKSLAVNLSDLAAMGAVPRVALITLGLGGDEVLDDLDALYDGVAELANAYGLAVIGGDTVRAPALLVGFAVTGEAELVDGRPRLLRRASARPGDLLLVSGHPGQAAAVLELLLAGEPWDGHPLVRAHRRPRPRLAEARWLLGQGVRCATDSSDGLWRETALLCAASGLSAEIEVAALPLSPALRGAFPGGEGAVGFSGGEEEKVVFASGPERSTATRYSTTSRKRRMTASRALG